jgi:hypothetical protein
MIRNQFYEQVCVLKKVEVIANFYDVIGQIYVFQYFKNMNNDFKIQLVTIPNSVLYCYFDKSEKMY